MSVERVDCEICQAMVREDVYEQHLQWHAGLNSRINEAAKVGEHADLMTRPIG